MCPQISKWALAMVLMAACTLPNTSVEGAKILGLNIMSTKSHKITYEKLLIALAERGHEVTYVGPIISGKNISTLREVQTWDLKELEKDMKFPNIFELKLSSSFSIFSIFMNPFIMFAKTQDLLCRKAFQLPIFKELLNEKFDLVFLTPLFNECLYGYVHLLNTSVVLYNQAGLLPWLAADIGTPSLPSFTPLQLFGYSDRMTYWERLGSMLFTAYMYTTLRFYYNPKVESIYRELLDPNLPSVSDIIKNTSIVLTNSHISFHKPRPLMSDIIEVGGLHMTAPKSVPKDLETFFAGAGEHGFIYFSMGSALKGSMMPENYRKMFLNVFSKLKQRVLWKWETEEMDDLPSNVKLSKWVPQPDILGDKRIRLFITHGGHGSTTEAIYYGVPLIGIPMLADQPFNIKQAAAAGFALPPLEFGELTEEILTEAINKILNDPSYTNNAKRLKNIYHDQINKPLDRAIYWIEYVIRHQGAKHLWSAARDLNFIQYFSLDVLATLFLVAVGITLIQFIIIRAIYRKLFKSKASFAAKSKKKQ